MRTWLTVLVIGMSLAVTVVARADNNPSDGETVDESVAAPALEDPQGSPEPELVLTPTAVAPTPTMTPTPLPAPTPPTGALPGAPSGGLPGDLVPQAPDTGIGRT